MTRVYRNVSTPIKIAGLELTDVAFMIALFLFVFNVSDGLFTNVGVIVGFYVVIRYSKRGKPAGYLIELASFLLSAPNRDVTLLDSLERYPKEFSRAR